MTSNAYNSTSVIADIPELCPQTMTTFKYWRLRVMYTMLLGYAAFYLTRQNFAMAMPAFQSEFGYSKTELGHIITIFSLTYGIGKLVNGVLSDRSNARYFMAFGLGVSALINIIFGFTENFWMWALLWGVNGWFQSMGWPPCARLLSHWFSPKELGTKWAFASSAHQIGGALIFIIAGFLVENYGWRQAFYVPGFICLLMSFFLLERLRDTPKSLGLPPVEHYKKVNLAPSSDDHLSFKEIIFHRVLCNRLVWYVSIASFFVYIVRMGIFNWGPIFLKEVKGSSLTVAGWQVAAYEVAGLIGGIMAGWLSDKVFHGRRGPVSTLYMILLTVLLGFLWWIPPGHQWLDALALIAIGFFVYGPQVLIGLAATDFATKKAAGTANGFSSTFGYFGAAVCGSGFGYIVDTWGWGGGFLFFGCSAICGIIFFLLTWHHRSKVLDGLHTPEPSPAPGIV